MKQPTYSKKRLVSHRITKDKLLNINDLYRKTKGNKRLKHYSIPKKLHIRGIQWRIFFERDLPRYLREDPQIKDEMEECWGITFPEERIIILSQELKKHYMASMRDMVFYHELMHAALPINNFLRHKIVGPKVEEKFIDNISPIMIEIMRQMKWRN